MNTNTRKLKSRSGTTLLKKSLPIAVLLASTATAVEAAMLEEVIVTAQKREQNLQDVGVSVTAFSGDQVREFGFTNSVDVVAQTPNLSFGTPTGEGNNVSLTLRGVGLSDFNDNNEGPVAVYVDEVYISALSGVTFQLFDLQRIEVLRGPQGTLYGRNTTGGLMHFVSKKPTEEAEGYVDLTVAENSQFKLEGAISGPLTENMQGRLSYAHNEYEGYIKNRGPGKHDPNDADNHAARGQLAFQPTQNLNILLNAHASKNDANASAWQHESTYSPDGGVTSLALPGDVDFYGTCPGCDAFGYVDNDDDPWAGAYDRDGDLVVENSGGSVHLDWDIGNDLTLTSITAYENFKRHYDEDTDISPFKIVHNTYTSDIDQFTQELRLTGEMDRLHWVAGAFYYDHQVDGGFQIDASGIGYIIGDANYTQDTESWSVFGQAEYELNDGWVLIGGLRYTDEERELDYLSRELNGLLPPGFNTMYDYDDTITHDNVTGKLELDWHPSDTTLVYASVSLGTKSAGFNTGVLDDTGVFGNTVRADVDYDEEELTSYEIGVKADIFGGTSRINAAAFYYDYSDFQAFAFVNLNQVIFNTDATVSGAELEFTSSPIEGLHIMLGAAYLDAQAEDIPLNDGSGIVRDRDMTLAPEFSMNGLIRYEWPAFSGRLAVQTDFTWQDDTYFDIQNHPASQQKAYDVWNARVSYTGGSENWSVAGFVNNVFEEEYRVYSFDVTNLFGFNQVAYGHPRWAGVTVNYNW
ncbi:MAG: TonB-dependent receptor [Halioglobus sp.]|nr:TonB-dependent receptor [Halioglobus sp.]